MAPLKCRILSAEEGTVFIHQLIRPKVSDAKCYQQALTLSRYRWALKFKLDISRPEPLLTIPYSFIGDLFVTVYAHSFSLWSKIPGKPFENVYCCHDAAECPVPAKISSRVVAPDNFNAELAPG